MPLSVWKPRRLPSDGHSIELEPRRPSVNTRLRTPGFGDYLRLTRMGKFRQPKPSSPKHSFSQRCAVQVRYTKGGKPGKWFSHGRYIERESAAKDKPGFDKERDDVAVAPLMSDWRKDGDQLFFRVIISPERGDRLDLKSFTRSVMADVEQDLGTALEWAAVAHYNTDKPHVHVALRGRRDDGNSLRIEPEYVKEGFRARAEAEATVRLGPRTENDIIEMQRREVTQMRFTNLDRKLLARGAHIKINTGSPDLKTDLQRATEAALAMRLRTLETIGLAEKADDGWKLDIAQLEKSLRAKQRVHDRQKIVAEHGVLASDVRMPFQVLKLRDLEDVEGRVLVHGQNEYSGNNYMLLESVEGKVLQVPHTKEIAAARKNGNFAVGSYVRIKRAGEKDFLIADYGEAAAVLRDADFLAENRKRLNGKVSQDWKGWLGELRAAIDVKRGPEQAPRI